MRHKTDQPVIRRRRASWTLACGIVLAMAAWSCAVKDHYKTLSFFFDGVPDPDAPMRGPTSSGGGADIRNSPTYSIHKPFKEEQCIECHSGMQLLSIQDSGICLKCHEPKTREHARMHGPVAAGACMWCHHPHESAQAHLMKKPARDVCTVCHETALLSAERVPAHADPAQSCLECHFGHGGAAQFFLRPSAGGPPVEPAPAPATPPGPEQSPEQEPGSGAVPR